MIIRRRKPSIHGASGPTAASTTQLSVWSGWVRAEKLAREGHVEEAVEMHYNASAAEQFFLWGEAFTPEEETRIREALETRFNALAKGTA